MGHPMAKKSFRKRGEKILKKRVYQQNHSENTNNITVGDILDKLKCDDYQDYNTFECIDE